MFDFNFDWSSDMETKISKIDIQHKEFFRIGRNMEQLLLTKCANVTEKELLDIVCELREYVGYDFYEEEVIMKDAGYSKLDEHVKQHNQFKSRIMNINCPALAANPYKELSKIRNFVVDWVFDHMLHEDMDMAREVRGKLG
ncbi:bacteriohemerythrin [[Clostridium] polysaccharolyticum]|jgi:hemerythrin|nr:hemerythrin family protein [[Clostridium] polysaccharolyticum]